MKDLLFAPEKIRAHAAELDQQLQQFRPLAMSEAPDSEFGAALIAAVERTNSALAQVHAYGQCVVHNSLRCLEHAECADAAHARHFDLLGEEA